MIVFVCPFCKSELEEQDSSLMCLECNIKYPVIDGIPDFMPSKVAPERKGKIRFVDRLSSIYETRIWYPMVYHFYGGFFIPSVKTTIEIITRLLEIEGGVAMDVACGTGLFARSIAREARQVYAFDISMKMLRKAREYAERDGLENIVFARAEVEHIPFSKGFFDGVSCCGALHLFPDVGRALREIGYVTKSGFKLAVMTFVKRGFLGVRRIYEHLEKDHHVHVFDENELSTLIKSAGYSEFKYSIYGSMILFEAKKI